MSESTRDLLRTVFRDVLPWVAVVLVAIGWVWSDSAAMATLSTTQGDHERRLTAIEMVFTEQSQALGDVKAELAALSAQIRDLRQGLGLPAAGAAP